MQEKINNSYRNIVYIDLLRIFTIFTVVLLHTSAQCWNETDVNSLSWQTMNLYNSFVRCNVSVFVMISGALLLDKAYKLNLKKLYSKNILRLFIAYMFWSFIYAVISYFNTENTVTDGFIYYVIKTTYNSHYHLWLLPVTIGLYMLMPMMKPLTESENAQKYCKYLLIIFFLFSVLSQSIFVFNVPYKSYFSSFLGRFYLTPMLGWTGFFILGYYLRTYDISRRGRIFVYLAGIAGFLVCWLGNSYFSIKAGVPNSFYFFNFSISCFTTAIAWFVFFKYRFENAEFSDKTKKIIKIFAKNSFGIYLIHAAVLKALYINGLNVLSFNPMISIPLISLLVFFISFVISYIIGKIPFVNKYIL